MVGKMRLVPAHGRHFHLAGPGGVHKAVALGTTGIAPPINGRAADFDVPSEGAAIGAVGGRLGEIEPLLKEPPVQFQHGGLRVGVADIGVAMRNEVNFLDHSKPYLIAPAVIPRMNARWKMRKMMISGSTTRVDAMFMRCHCASRVLL